MKQGFDDGLFKEGSGTLADTDAEDVDDFDQWDDESDAKNWDDDDPLKEDDRRAG